MSTNIFSCPAVYDNLCWPNALANQTVKASCASLPHHGVDPTKSISRLCLPSGQWGNASYAGCFYPDVLALMLQSYKRKTVEERGMLDRIVRAVRIIELVGLSTSLISVLLSLLIFFVFKSLYCSRTKIHINLLLAILIQIIARLTSYGIQMFQVSHPLKSKCDVNGLVQPYRQFSVFALICSLVIVCLQFGKTAMFMWMLCEGIHLNNVLTVSVFKNHFKQIYFFILGWAVPFLLTLSWSLVMIFREPHRRCFNNYMHLKFYWIIDGPRYAVMIINVIFLLNIIRVLLVKMKEGSENRIREDKRRGSMNAKYVRKAVKAAIFLLPLLGILHILETFVSADNQPIRLFAIYSSVTYLLLTLQGFFCSLLYCFLNVEVRETISRRFQTTQLWYRWKRYFAKKEQQHRFETMTDDHFPGASIETKKSPIELEERRLTIEDDGGNPRNHVG